MLSHNLPIKIEPQQNEAYNTKFKTNIVWKQLFHNPHIVDASYWSVNATFGTKTVADNKMTYTITTKNANQAITQPNIAFTQNHIYLLSCWLTVSEDQVVGIYTGNAVTNIANVKANVRTRIFNVFKSNVTSTRTCYIYPARNGGLPIGGTVVVEDGCLYDLTEMFGEGKETLGRFSFLSNFPNNYYDYNVDGDPVPFTIPVYGGSINIKTGLLQITKYNIDLGYLYWQYSAAQASTGKYRKACTEVLFEATSSTSDVPDLISSGYQTLSNGVSYQFTQGIAIATNSTIYICDERYSAQNDMPAFANAVKGITACGVMVSPVTYNLTPIEVKTLLGNNKINSNATELQLTYKNSQNENVSLTGNTEYTIEDGVFDRSVASATNLFSPKQNLNGQDYPWLPGCGKNRIDESIQYQPVPTKLYVGCQDDYTIRLPAGDYEFACRGRSIMYQAYIQKEGAQTAQALFDNAPFDYMIDSATLTGGNYKFWFENSNGVDSAKIEWLNIQKDVTFDGRHYPYANICPIEGYTESSVTVKGDRVPDSESERRLKTITRPVFQWDVGLKLKFEGYTFADGTLCQFDNKITVYSLNATIENNECAIPYQLLDENCQGDIVAYINVSGNNYDVVVYEVYIPVIKRPKPENFLRPAIDLPSAVIASFTDGADNVPLEKLKIAVTPKQDLHGYDYPWIGGGGKNKINLLDSDQHTITNYYAELTVNNGSISSYKIKESTTFTLSFTVESSVEPFNISIGRGNGTYSRDIKTVSNLTNGRVSVTTTISDLSDGRDILAIRCVRFSQSQTFTYRIADMQVEEASSATAYEPYSNICPITGYTEVNVTRTGKNKLNYDVWKTVNVARGTAVWENNGVTLTATGNDCYTHYGSFPESARIPVKEGDAVKLSWEESTNKSGDCYIFSGTGAPHVHSNNAYSKSCQLTVGNGVTFVTMRMGVTNSGDTISYKNIMVQVNSSETNYESYKGQTYNVPFTDAPKVGEGTLDIKTGVLTITKKFKEFNGTEDWQSVGGSYPQAYSLRTGETNARQWFPDAESRGISSLFKWNTAEVQQYGIRWQTLRDTSTTNRGLLYAYDASILNNLVAFKTLLTEHPLQIVYQLIAPEIYQLTPTEVKTLLGYNNIWADTGEVEVSYYADPYLHFID